MKDTEKKHYYSALLSTPIIGEKGVFALQQKHVTLIGIGGLGSIVAQLLVRTGIKKLTIIDHDSIYTSNLGRQILYSYENIGESKTKVATSILQGINPDCEIVAHSQLLTKENISELLTKPDLIIDATDNFPTKFLLHNFAFESRINFITASVFRFEGRLQVFSFATYDHLPKKSEPCLYCTYGEIPKQPFTTSCHENGILSTTVALLGTLEANEAIKLLVGLLPLPSNLTQFVDLETTSFYQMKQERRVDCSYCNAIKHT